VIVDKIANYFPGNFSGSYIFTSFANFAANNPRACPQLEKSPGGR
jgi:uncharacterized protein YcsI (UPF0317 family)